MRCISGAWFVFSVHDKVLFFEFVLCFVYVLMNWVFFVFSFKVAIVRN